MPIISESAAVAADKLLDDGRLVVVPQWIVDSEVCDRAVRLYAVLASYRQSSGSRMPTFVTMARRLKAPAGGDVSAALQELADVGAVGVQVRTVDRGRLLSSYELRTARPPGFVVTTVAARKPATVDRGSSSGDRSAHGAAAGREPIWSLCQISDWPGLSSSASGFGV